MPFAEGDWHTLIRRIRNKQCLPIIGAGASAHRLPLGEGLALELARLLNAHPPPNPLTLEQTAQRLAVQSRDANLPKEEAAEIIKKHLQLPRDPIGVDPYDVLARMALPIYVTTNYDDLMTQALRQQNRPVTQEYCRWNSTLLDSPSALENNYEPKPDAPYVFHLHGHANYPRSIVISEDDYLDFLVNVSVDLATVDKTKPMLPYQIRDGLKNFTLLFVGYRLSDVNFRVILRGLLGRLQPSQRAMSLTVQVIEGTSRDEVDQMKKYLDAYFGWSMNLQVYWGTAETFMAELQRRLNNA